MVRIVIYGEHAEETDGLEMMLRAILTEKQRWPVIHTYIGNLENYLHFVRGNPYLIMLVSAFAGYKNTMHAYHEAVKAEYRFFSYGDAMFITYNPQAISERP